MKFSSRLVGFVVDLLNFEVYLQLQNVAEAKIHGFKC